MPLRPPETLPFCSMNATPARLDTNSNAVGVARWPIYPSQDAIGLSQRSP